jgi:hypothetical protein
MPARRRRTLPIATTLIVLTAGTLGACGGSDDSKLLSRSSAAELRSTLAQVEQQINNGDCGAAQDQISNLEDEISSLDSVSENLRDALVSGTSRLRQLVNNQCQTQTTETGSTGATGTTDTGGTSAPDEQQDEPGKSEGKGKGKKKGHKKDKGLDVQIEPDTGGSTEGGGTTGSGGAAP